ISCIFARLHRVEWKGYQPYIGITCPKFHRSKVRTGKENNAASYISRSIAQGYIEKPMPESYNLATSVSDEAAIESLLENAGFADPTIEKIGLFSISPTAR